MIPVNTPLLQGNEIAYLNECVQTGWVSSEGRFVAEFENAMASYVGRKNAVSVSSGTAALELAVLSLRIGEGDEVILPALTIISCATAVIRSGATPVLVDCDALTFNMDPNEIRKRITPKTKAIMVVHLYGLPCEMDPILQIAKEFKLKIIEDAAEMLGQTYNGKKCGSFGDVSVFSFYANKIVTCGEGGMVLSDSEEIAERSRKLRNLAFEKSRRFRHEELGWNYRMTNLQAALGLAQLEQIEKFIARKKKLGRLYHDSLKSIPNLQFALERTTYAENIYWVFPLILKGTDKDAAWLAQELEKKKISTRPFFFPLHQQPALRKMNLFLDESYPVTEILSMQGLYLPSGTGTTDEEIATVCDAVKVVMR